MQRAPKSPKNVKSTFFNTARFLLEHLRFEHGGAKLASCPGRHLTSLRPWRLHNNDNTEWNTQVGSTQINNGRTHKPNRRTSHYCMEPLCLHTCNNHSVGIMKARCISKVFANLRLPYQTCTTGKMNNDKDWLSRIHLQFRTELNFQKTSYINYWKSNNYQTASCSNCWSVTCQNTLAIETENNFKTETLSASTRCYWKNWNTHCRIAMTSVTITERNMMIKDVKKQRSSLWFSLAPGPHFENSMGPTPALHKQLRYKV